MSNKNSDHYFLTGGGEMGELIRAKDWGQTALGDPENWPQSLRTMVSVMLDNPLGMYIAWGREYIQLYNDGFRPILGSTKHPQALGAGTHTTFSEIWDTISPMFEGVMEGSPVRYTDLQLYLNRNGYEEECYFDFAYSPIRKDNGEVGGVLVTVIETTNQKKTEERLKESKRLYETITQNTPDLIYVFDLNYRFTYANDALLNMWGSTWDNAIGKSLLENGYEPWHAEMHEREIDLIIATKKPVRGEVSFPHATLGKRVYDYILVPVIDQDGKVEAIAGTTRDITQQVDARKHIEESEMRFRNMVEQAPVAICVLRGENYVVEVANETQLALWGTPKEQVLDKPIFTAIPEGRGQGFEALLYDVFSTGKPFIANELPTELTRNGIKEIFYANFTYQPLYDSAKKINGIISVSVDVTQQVTARKKIQESEERFRSLAEALPQLTWVTDEKGNSEFASFRWKEYSGVEPNGEKEWKSIVHPDDYDNINAAWIHSLNTGNFYKADVRLLSKNGEYRWHTVNGEPVLDKENKIVKWVGAFTDTHVEKTFSKALEEKVITRTAELKASEEKFYSLFNLSPVCKTLSDKVTGKIVMVNDAFTKLFGYSREETLNKSSAELGLLDLDTREIMINELQVNGKVENKELSFIKKSGERFIALASAEVISMTGKQFFLSAFNDISEIKKAEQNIKQKNIELEKMNKELQSFAYISSHDLQEPLRKIQTFAARITDKEEHNLSEYGKDMFNRMQNAAKRMQTLIQDLLAYSRANTTDHKFETTDLHEIIAEVQEDLKEELKEKHAVIEANQLSHADIIPFQFRQLMLNLIGNALKFSRPNHPPIIQIRSEIATGIQLNNEKLTAQNKYCHITVSDNGIGFEEKYNEKIFEVFQRLHGKNEYDGTGIGLSIVKKIVENHNGFITATGELNKGSTFDIYIPVTINH